VFSQDLVAGFFEALDGKNIRRGQSTSEGNDLRALRDLQQFTDGGAFDPQRALCVF
jgi:hypothetical protein